MREAENISAVSSLDIDLMGFIFCEGSPRNVKNITVHAGIIPDMANADINDNVKNKGLKTVGVFVDEMPQTLITQVYNYKLDYIQLHGDESAVYIENLKSTLIPDIAPNIKIIKAINICEADDVKRWRSYEGLVDMIIFDTKGTNQGGNGKQFDWSLLDYYDGEIPFLLSGGLGPDSVEDIINFKHHKFAGVDLNSLFETEPGVKDVEKLKQFIEKIRIYEQNK